jgi:hypothetical protein
MDLKGKLKKLIEDAVTLWRDPEARRPLTRRGVDESTLLEAYERSQESGKDVPQSGSGKKSG